MRPINIEKGGGRQKVASHLLYYVQLEKKKRVRWLLKQTPDPKACLVEACMCVCVSVCLCVCMHA